MHQSHTAQASNGEDQVAYHRCQLGKLRLCFNELLHGKQGLTSLATLGESKGTICQVQSFRKEQDCSEFSM